MWYLNPKPSLQGWHGAEEASFELVDETEQHGRKEINLDTTSLCGDDVTFDLGTLL